MRFADFMQQQQIVTRTKKSAANRQGGRAGANGHALSVIPPEGIMTKANRVGSCEPVEFHVPRPDDEEFCQRVEALLAEADQGAKEIMSEWKSQSPS